MLNTENNSMGTMDPGIHAVEKRKVYSKPCLEELGDLRTVTLGTSNGLGESGHEASHWNGPFETESPF